MHQAATLCIVVLFFIAGCTEPQDSSATRTPEPEVISLTGTPLYPPDFPAGRLAELTADYNEAKAAHEANPANPDHLVWLGRRAGYLWQYQEAIDWFTKGIEQHPDDPRFYRHRGHRYITLRQFDKAVADFEQAVKLIEVTEDVVEPDGAPNAAGIPTSTLHTNIGYDLGLAHNLNGDFDKALSADKACLLASKNNDMYVATADWLYMTFRRLGQEEQADAILDTVTEDMALLENFAYHRRLMMYKGLLQPEELLTVDDDGDQALNLATQGYGVGNWYLYNDQPERAREIFEQVLQGDYWAAFGYIAAEVELAG